MFEWVDTAPCRGLPTEWFFPDTETPGDHDWSAGKTVCAECPHRKPCLFVALNFETPDVRRFGLWGGLTPKERDRLMEPR
jgi:WhiB family redox-sensing transcriptional regulator